MPVIGPGSLRMAFTSLRNPLRHTPLQMLAGWLPAGIVSTDSLQELVRRAVADEWVEHPNYWAVACDYQSGRRVPFGRIDAPRADIAQAVAASCAIPGFYRPVRINGRRYVDGGVCSVSNLDLVAGRGLDLVICLNPLTSSDREEGLLDLLPVFTNGSGRRRLAHEERKLRRFGSEVLVIEPTAEDRAVMGRNWMNARAPPAGDRDRSADGGEAAPRCGRARPPGESARGRAAQDRAAAGPGVELARAALERPPPGGLSPARGGSAAPAAPRLHNPGRTITRMRGPIS